MKQMRSRFRLITLLLACAFLLTVALCAGKTLKTAGVSFSTLLDSLKPIESLVSEHIDNPPEEASGPVSTETLPEVSSSPAADISPVPEYNEDDIVGL